MLKAKIFQSKLSAGADAQFNEFMKEHPGIYVRSFQFDANAGAGHPSGAICIMYEEYTENEILGKRFNIPKKEKELPYYQT